MELNTIADRIKFAMIQNNVRQIDIVNRTGISKSSINQYVSKYVEPKSENLYLISEALGVEFVWLLLGKEPMKKEVVLQEEFCVNLSKAMARANIKPIELSRLTGIPKGTISQYMSGYSTPRHDRLQQIAFVLGVNPVWLMGYQTQMENASKNNEMVDKIQNDEPLMEVLHQYFESSEETRKKVIQMINVLCDNQA